MKVLGVLVLGLAVTLSAGANTCSIVCSNICSLSKTACGLTEVVGPVCDLGSVVCSKVCELACTCPDKCQTQCTPALDACKTKYEGRFIGLADCTTNFGYCVTFCEDQCFDGVSKNVLGSLQKVVTGKTGIAASGAPVAVETDTQSSQNSIEQPKNIKG